MVSYADVCLFSQNLTMPLRLSRDDVRDSTRFNEEVTRAFPGRAPRYDGQYHIDFWLSKVEDSFALLHLPEEDKCEVVERVLSKDVFKACDAMQCSRVHRGKAAINDWPTLKAILRCVFLPLTQLDTTLLVHLPSPDDPVLSDLSRKADSLSLLTLTSTARYKAKEVLDKLHAKHESYELKEMIDASQHKLAGATHEIQNLLDESQRKLVLATVEIQDLLYESEEDTLELATEEMHDDLLDSSEDNLELAIRELQDLLDASQVKLALATREIHDLLAQCSTKLSPPKVAKKTTTTRMATALPPP